MMLLRCWLLLMSAPLLLGAGEGAVLRYRARLHLRGDAAPLETRFTLSLGPVAETANRKKLPRLAPWRLEATQQAGGAPQALLLARLERMLYLSGPAPETEIQNLVVRYGDRSCRVWRVEAPEGLTVFAYLVEVAPGLLALSHLSGQFERGDLVSAEIQLETLAIGPKAGPAEQGQALLATLRRLAVRGGAATGDPDAPVRVE